MARTSNQQRMSVRDRVPPQAARVEKAPARLTRRVRLLMSIALIYHLLAVFIGTWIGSPPTSPFADEVARPFRHYIALADLNHGYRFFAPNPGPSHLFRYRLTFDDGTTRESYFPNRSEHRPRLFYHRYFMLAENLNVLAGNASPAASTDLSNDRFDALAHSYATQLLSASGAGRIDWEFVRHYQPAPADVLSGRLLTDEQFYETLERGSLERVRLEQEQGQ